MSNDLHLFEQTMNVSDKTNFKDGYLDFSHLTKLDNIYISEIYTKKQYKPSIIKNYKITNKISFDGIPLTGYVAS